MTEYKSCVLCNRKCGIDRASTRGRCGVGSEIRVSRAALHFWEEPIISGERGSGTIFFSGCSLGCIYCQNRAISQAPTGEKADSIRLREMMEDLVAQGAENIDLVTPTHFLPTLCLR